MRYLSTAPLLAAFLPGVVAAADPVIGNAEFLEAGDRVFLWSNYLFAAFLFVSVPLAFGSIGIWLTLRFCRGLREPSHSQSIDLQPVLHNRRSRGFRVWSSALLVGIACSTIPFIASMTISYCAYFPVAFPWAPTPTQSADTVNEVLGIRPDEVLSIDISPYVRPKVGKFPYGQVSFDNSEAIVKICDALHSARTRKRLGEGESISLLDPSLVWQSWFIIRTKTATHKCYVSKRKSNAALIDIFYEMSNQSNMQMWLGTYECDDLATVLESAAKERIAAK